MPIDGGGESSSKCLGRGTRVVRLDMQLKNVEDIKIGDKLMGSDDKSLSVLKTCEDQMFLIKQAEVLIEKSNQLIQESNRFIQETETLIKRVREFCEEAD